MVRFELNGRPFDPKTFEETILKAVMDRAAIHLRERISSIRHPETGEFPTVLVSATSLTDVRATVEGSPDLLAIVSSRLGSGGETAGAAPGDSVGSASSPRVFLSYAWENRELAGQIAHALQANGIDTFWAGWSMGPGDSLVQKINEGLSECTHFVVLLTPVSMQKPWVKQEMDAALIRRIADRCMFIPLRHDVSAVDLPPLMAMYLSPELTDHDADIRQLINDIHGVSRKPTLGRPPAAVTTRPTNSVHSAAAMAVARVFVETSAHGMWADPQLGLDEIADQAGLTVEDAEDAIHELSGVTENHHGTIFPKAELFVAFDSFFRDWDPAADAFHLATDMVNDPDFPNEPSDIAERFGWPARRLNPAIAYLSSRGLIQCHQSLGSSPYNDYIVEKTPATRRFVKSRS